MLYFYICSGILGGLALIALFVWLNNNLLTVKRYGLACKGLEREVNIVHLSDLHGKRFGKGNSRLVKKIISERPDFIAITGDIIHLYRQKDCEVALELVNTLSAVAPVIYVSGNHEMRNKGYRQFRARLSEAGATVLDDCTRNICGLTVIGLNCASLKNGTLAEIMPKDGFKLLLAHMPQFIDKYAECGADVVLCGHAHGGQWRIPFTGQGIYSPGQGMFPKLTAGVHTRGKTRMVISRGLGNSQCPLRLFNPPEIVSVKLKNE